MTFSSSYWEVGKIKGLRNQDSTITQLLLVTLCKEMFRLYLCFNRQWIFLTVWIGTQKGMHVLHVCLLSWTIFWNYHWTLKEKVRKFQLLNYQYFIAVSSSRMTVWMLWKEKLPHTSAPWGMGLTKKTDSDACQKFWKEPLLSYYRYKAPCAISLENHTLTTCQNSAIFEHFQK